MGLAGRGGRLRCGRWGNENRHPDDYIGNAVGVCDGLDLAIQVVQAGGALPLETSEDGK
jgi:hypothetical protein